MSDTIDRLRQREAINREIFERDLRVFVDRYCPRSWHEGRDFQVELMLLLRDAMTTQRDCFSLGGQQFYEAMSLYSDRAAVSLNAIFPQPSTSEKAREFMQAVEAAKQATLQTAPGFDDQQSMLHDAERIPNAFSQSSQHSS